MGCHGISGNAIRWCPNRSICEIHPQQLRSISISSKQSNLIEITYISQWNHSLVQSALLPGNRLHEHGKSQFERENSLYMAMFNSYVTNYHMVFL